MVVIPIPFARRTVNITVASMGRSIVTVVPAGLHLSTMVGVVAADIGSAGSYLPLVGVVTHQRETIRRSTNGTVGIQSNVLAGLSGASVWSIRAFIRRGCRHPPWKEYGQGDQYFHVHFRCLQAPNRCCLISAANKVYGPIRVRSIPRDRVCNPCSRSTPCGLSATDTCDGLLVGQAWPCRSPASVRGHTFRGHVDQLRISRPWCEWSGP